MAHNLDRQQSLKLTLPSLVHIVGVGGVGSWLAYFLALAGVPELWLWDADTISETNLNRLPVGPDSLNQSKSEAIANLIRRVKPTCHAEALGLWTVAIADHCERPNWIAVCTDTAASRRTIYDWSLNAYPSPYYIELSAEGEVGGVTGEPATFSTPKESDPGYASVPVWVGPCVMSAAIACGYILHNQPIGSRVQRVGFTKDSYTKDPSYLVRRAMMWYDSLQPIGVAISDNKPSFNVTLDDSPLDVIDSEFRELTSDEEES